MGEAAAVLARALTEAGRGGPRPLAWPHAHIMSTVCGGPMPEPELPIIERYGTEGKIGHTSKGGVIGLDVLGWQPEHMAGCVGKHSPCSNPNNSCSVKGCFRQQRKPGQHLFFTSAELSWLSGLSYGGVVQALKEREKINTGGAKLPGSPLLATPDCRTNEATSAPMDVRCRS